MERYSLMTGERMDVDDERHPTEYPPITPKKRKVRGASATKKKPKKATTKSK